MTTSEEQFHEELVAMVSQGQRDDGSVPGLESAGDGSVGWASSARVAQRPACDGWQ